MSDDATDADNQMEESPSFRPAPGHQKRCNIWLLVLGALLIFVIGMAHILYLHTSNFLLNFVTWVCTCTQHFKCYENPLISELHQV